MSQKTGSIFMRVIKTESIFSNRPIKRQTNSTPYYNTIVLHNTFKERYVVLKAHKTDYIDFDKKY